MPSVTLQIADFMDAAPIAGANITFRYNLVPEFLPRQISGEIQNTELNVRRDMQRGLVATGQTDANGMVTATFHIEATRAEVASLLDEAGHPPAVINGWMDVEFDIHGIDMKRSDVLARVPVDDDQSIQLPVDFGMSIVGHTTPSSARLWFRTTFKPSPDQSLFCRISTEAVLAPAGRQGSFAPRPGAFGGTDYPVQIKGSANTATIDVQLSKSSRHDYSLILKRGIRETELTLLRGSFSTPPSDQHGVEFAFGSCHLPVDTGYPEPNGAAFRGLNRWRELAERSGHDFLILMGDQIYGDDINIKFPRLKSFEEQYNARYAQLWGYRPTRQVLRNEPTYMILDDHEVKDDFGPGNIPDKQVTAGIDAYRAWQESHNPDGPSGLGPPFHYHFRQGPASFFVVDCRTGGGQAAGYPVFGAQQLTDFQAWASSEETLNADVIFLVSPIPPALLPAELLRALAESVTANATSLAGSLLGLGIGSLLGGPLGAGVGAVGGAAVLGSIGYQLGEEIYQEWVDPWLLNSNDLAERWDLDTNQPDLKILLDTLFNLANGIGEPNPRKRAVFILAGDIHVGSAHSIVSLHSEHADNPVIYQLASSAISHPPVDQIGYRKLVSEISEDSPLAGFLSLNIPVAPEPTAVEDNLVKWTASGPNVQPTLTEVVVDSALETLGSGGPARFLLDPNVGSNYVANYHALIIERTVGYARVVRVYPARRVYRFEFEISGEQGDILSTFDLDLDAQKIVPILGGAEYVAIRAPSQVDRGVTFAIEVDVRNTSPNTWTRESKCTMSLGPWAGRSVAVTGTVGRGQTDTFIFSGRLDIAGTFAFQFQMLADDGTVAAASEPITIAVSNSTVAACAELAARHTSASTRLRTLQQASQNSGDPLGTIQRLIAATAGEIAEIETRQGHLGC